MSINDLIKEQIKITGIIDAKLKDASEPQEAIVAEAMKRINVEKELLLQLKENHHVVGNVYKYEVKENSFKTFWVKEDGTLGTGVIARGSITITNLIDDKK